MNIIIEKQQNSRLEDGINEILSLDDETFEEVITQLNPSSKIEDIHFFYVTDKCEMPSANIQLGLEKTIDENGKFIGRSYFGGEATPILEILKMLNGRLEDLDKNSQEYSKITRLLQTRDLKAFKSFLCKTNRTRQSTN